MKLDIGCGSKPRLDFLGIDRKLGSEAYPLTDSSGGHIPDESVEEIIASHVLEHFSHHQVADVLREWVRVLKPGGTLSVAVPDLQWIASNYLAGNNINVQGFLMGGQSDPNDFHATAFDREVLTSLLKTVGLVDIQRWNSDKKDCASLPCSLNLQGTKPKPLPRLKIGCAMSVPRLGFQENFFCWAQALQPYGISPVKYDGAFWGMCLERVMTNMAEGGADWILTLDYDTVVTHEHVGTLIRLAAEHPEADALSSMQMGRGRIGAKPLWLKRDEEGNPQMKLSLEELQSPLLKVQTAHFGLTMIRCSSLLKMAHPWFQGLPDPNGRWEEGRIDDDIHFWHKWEKAGNSLYIANRVVVGHAEVMITWPDRELNPIHQYPSDYHENGLPEGMWQ